MWRSNTALLSNGLQEFHTTLDEWVRSPIGIFVPAVGGTNLDFREKILHFLDPLQELLSVEVAAVEGFGANRDGVDCIRARGLEGTLKGTDVGVEGCICIGPGQQHTVSCGSSRGAIVAR